MFNKNQRESSLSDAEKNNKDSKQQFFIFPPLSSRTEVGVKTVCQILDTLIRLSDTHFELKENKPNIFEVNKIPKISLLEYLTRLSIYIIPRPVSENKTIIDDTSNIDRIFIATLIYIDRYITVQKYKISYTNIHRLLLASLCTSLKYHSDYFFTNLHYAKVGGITTEQLNKLVKTFLFGIDFNLYVSPNDYENYAENYKAELFTIINFSILSEVKKFLKK